MFSKRRFTCALLIALSLKSTASAFIFGTFGTYNDSSGLPPCSVGCCGGGRPAGFDYGLRSYRPWTYAERYYFLNRAYPKYNHGLHSSYYQSIGLPPGDIGLRSYGIHPTPW